MLGLALPLGLGLALPLGLCLGQRQGRGVRVGVAQRGRGGDEQRLHLVARRQVEVAQQGLGKEGGREEGGRERVSSSV